MHQDPSHPATLPCPPLTQVVELARAAEESDPALTRLPARPGVLVMEDASGATLALLQTSDVRRAAQDRLGRADSPTPRSRRADLRPLVKRVRALSVGSSFESDWATLQLARVRLPHSYRSMIDRWQAWFLHCDDGEPFPQWVKTAHPIEAHGTHVGPFGDKHAAARFREILEDTFDLCRFHHILVQSPNGRACAYKEMGRCPAPCDGSVTVNAYREQITASIDFARNPNTSLETWARQMLEHSTSLDFEQAARLKDKLQRTKACRRREFSNVRDLNAFRFLALAPSDKPPWVRIFAIVGGWIAPIIDCHGEESSDRILDDVFAAARDFAPVAIDRSSASLENIGLVCRHLQFPKAKAKRRRCEFLVWDELDEVKPQFRAALKRVLRRVDPAPVGEEAQSSIDTSQELELES